MNFKQFLLLEQKQFLAHKIADLLSMVEELLSGGKQIGARQLVKHANELVIQIRKVLHSSWTRSERKYLLVLQKCGVALAKTIDDKGDLSQTLNGVRSEIGNLTSNMGEPINQLAVPEDLQTQPMSGIEQKQKSVNPSPIPNE